MDNEFTYQLSDIRCRWLSTDITDRFVICPDCHYKCNVIFKKNLKEIRNENNRVISKSIKR